MSTITGAVAITQEMVATSDVNQTGIAFTYNDASGKSVTRSTMMDFNGDGFPDIFQNGIIQYTNSQGGISGEKYSGIELSAARTSLKDGHWEATLLFR